MFMKSIRMQLAAVAGLGCQAAKTLPRFCLGSLLAVSLVACGSMGTTGSTESAGNRLVTTLSPYKIDVVQGNFVSKEQAQALKVGMSRLQVKDILGTPLLTSVFHADRWDYVFTFRRQGLAPQARAVTVYFKNDVLERFAADNLPTEAEFVSSLDSGRSTGKVPVLEASPEALAKFAPVAAPAVRAASAGTAALPVAPERYPPLESRP
jgi:outer membrane protein assembly factor BamE